MKTLLVLTHSAGFKHGYLPTAEERLTTLGEQSGLFRAEVVQDCGKLTAEGLAKCDAYLFATTGELPLGDDLKGALVQSVLDGKAFIGVHNAVDTMYEYAEYGRMLGGYFNATLFDGNNDVSMRDSWLAGIVHGTRERDRPLVGDALDFEPITCSQQESVRLVYLIITKSSQSPFGFSIHFQSHR